MLASQNIPTKELMFTNTSELIGTMSNNTVAKVSKSNGKKGSRGPKYDDKILSDVVRELLPTCSEEWKMVGKEYLDQSLEAEERDHQSLRRHFHEKLCDKFRAPTGKVKCRRYMFLYQIL